MHAANLSVSSAGRRDLKISLSPSMGTSSEPVYLTGKAVKRTPPSWQLLLPPASVADSPASPSCRRRSCEPVCLISSDPVCLISRNKRSQDISFSTSSSPCATTRHSRKLDGSVHKVSILSLGNHSFLPNDNLSQPHVSSQWQITRSCLTSHNITQQHNNKQNTQTFAFITFHI